MRPPPACHVVTAPLTAGTSGSPAHSGPVCPGTSVISDSLRPHGPQTTRLLCPWGFSGQEHWSGLPCPPPGDLPDPGIEPTSPISPAWAGGFFTTSTASINACSDKSEVHSDPPQPPQQTAAWGQLTHHLKCSRLVPARSITFCTQKIFLLKKLLTQLFCEYLSVSTKGMKIRSHGMNNPCCLGF